MQAKNEKNDSWTAWETAADSFDDALSSPRDLDAVPTRPALIALTVPRVSDTAKPEMESYSRHAIVCTGRFCSPQGGGRAIYARLAQMLDREDLLFGPARVKRSEAPCLGVCAGGPVVAVYPEGVWYHSVDIPMLDRIVCEHLRDGHPVLDRVFHQLGTTRPNEPLAKGVKTKQ